MSPKRATRSDSAPSATRKAKKQKRLTIHDTDDEESDDDVANEEQYQDEHNELHHDDGKATTDDGKDEMDNNEEDDDNEEGEEETFYFDQDQSSPSKRKSIESMEAFRTTSGGNSESLSIELVQGGYELVEVQKANGDDGFLHPVRKGIQDEHPGLRSYGFITVATRRIGPESDEPLLNSELPGNSSGARKRRNDGQPFPKQYIVRAVNKSNKKTRREVLNYLARFLNGENRKSPPRGVDKDEWMNRPEERYVVPENFDRTPKKLSELRKLDYHLTSKAISGIIYHTMDNVSRTWARDNPKLASAFFSPPYPEIAVQNFGYHNGKV